MAKTVGKPEYNPITQALMWMLDGSSNSSRVLGFKYDHEYATLTIKKMENLRVMGELVVNGVKDSRRVIEQFNDTQTILDGGIESPKEY